ALTGTLTHTGKHRQTAVLLGDVVDEFQHVHGLAHAGAAEQADLTALGERADQVDNLDAGFQQLDRRRELCEGRSQCVDGTALVGVDRTDVVDRTAENVHDSAQGATTDGHRDGSAGAGDGHAAAQAVGRAHGDGAYNAVTQLLLDFER